jgi:hypothetical protein
VRGLSLLAALVAALSIAAVAWADTAPIANTPDLPWTNPDHTSNLEVLAGQIASRLSGRTVTARCEGDTDWSMLAQQRHFDPTLELGYVSVVNTPGQPLSLANVTELAGGNVCLPLKNFASAIVKPTKCTPAVAPTVVAMKRKTAKKARPAAPGPCYLGAGKVAAPMPHSFWTGYGNYAQAIETLAHESMHLSGVFSESVAQCSGMQWIQSTAVQLGDTPDDGEAIAKFVWDYIYPEMKTSAPAYWSADCRPGGPLDIRTGGKTDWP